MRKDRFDEIYDAMLGLGDCPGVEDEFLHGECGQLYANTFDARVRLSMQTDGNDSGENADTVLLMRSYEKMQYLLCRKAYEYGFADGLKNRK